MKQCKKCNRFLSDSVGHCLFCEGTELKPVDFLSPSLNENIEISFSDIRVDDHAYNIIRLLGKGGFGTVIQVFDLADNKFYAMKVPLIFNEIYTNNQGNEKEKIKSSQDSLEKEIEMFSKFKDNTFLSFIKKGTARFTSKGESFLFPVLIMELAQGTVKDIIKYENDGNKIGNHEKAKIIREIANAIARLHGKGGIHRDLSPDNLFMVDREGTIYYVLGDLGAGKDLYKNNPQGISSRPPGHPPYIDPCRIKDNKYKDDYRIDVYSLGIIITEILMGRFWWEFFKMEDIRLTAIDFEKDFLLKTGAEFIKDHNVLEVLRKAVKSNIDERYQSIDAFRKSISKVLIPFLTGSEPPMPHKSKTEVFDFYFTLQLPFRIPDQTYLQSQVQYKGEKKLILPDYQGIKITFDRFRPSKALVKGTTLYSVTTTDNAILLNFKNNQFSKLLNFVEAIEKEMKGELHFKGVLEVEGEMR